MPEEQHDFRPPTLDIAELPFETKHLREALTSFLDKVVDVSGETPAKLGNYIWGVYAFYDYDGEPIYVGQTNEQLRTRIRRHLTNQRTDAVAMNVLDPFEVCYIEVWPLPQFQEIGKNDKAAKKVAKEHLDALEYNIFQKLLNESRFGAVLNEKDPPAPRVEIEVPQSHKERIVTDEVSALRDHPDLRIARRAMTLARLAQVICERKVQKGLRKVLLTQAKRLQWLSERRCELAAEINEEE
ncbi:GIY-YIG domain nuclease, putative [Geotalea daltonii FRC-32]|uniref:GIY-YIG domain nuclease, putative n=1 Tax=Geotalea daltonii (strain DSM 22248 / JCM 15807 / FRC-32) TaxID=316067 RepID=B9M104_GEODF|nr:GIY-YIG nuclease family protein [Geotalea daltonii]ACM19074.1 GIY-YIG domain nuclease, putative [Geotalea daltonii FRC-32]